MFKKLFTFAFIAANFVNTFAAECGIAGDDPPNASAVACVLGNILAIIVSVAGLVFVAMIAFGAIKFGMAGGDPKGYMGAKLHWQHAVIGVMIIAGMAGIFSIVGGLLGVGTLSPSAMVGALQTSIQSLFDLAAKGTVNN